MPEVTRDEFKQGLIEAYAIVKALSQHCRTVDELLELLEVSQTNAAQASLLMQAVLGVQSNRRAAG